MSAKGLVAFRRYGKRILVLGEREMMLDSDADMGGSSGLDDEASGVFDERMWEGMRLLLTIELIELLVAFEEAFGDPDGVVGFSRPIFDFRDGFDDFDERPEGDDVEIGPKPGEPERPGRWICGLFGTPRNPPCPACVFVEGS